MKRAVFCLIAMCSARSWRHEESSALSAQISATNFPRSSVPLHASHKTIYVNCHNGSQSGSGTSPETAMRTLQKALGTGADRIEISGGMCPVSAPILINQAVVIHGDGKTALSGGQAVVGWKPGFSEVPTPTPTPTVSLTPTQTQTSIHQHVGTERPSH